MFTAAGHEVRILPAQFVKPYLKSNKNDFNDAAAIAEAAGRASMRYVPLKTTEQLELQALHRVRRRFIVERTAVINQMRALLLEHGMVIPVGRAAFVHRLPTISVDAEQRLSPRLLLLLHRLRQRWLALDVEITQATRDLTEWADQSALCRRAATVPGIGPMIATAVVAAVGDGRMFTRGRDMAAWLGLVPRQHSTGGKPTLGPISKRGNTYLRELFVQGAQSSFVYLKRDQSSLGRLVAPGRDASTAPGGDRRLGEQDGPHLLEGPHERGRISPVPGSSRVTYLILWIARSTLL